MASDLSLKRGGAQQRDHRCIVRADIRAYDGAATSSTRVRYSRPRLNF